MHSRAGSVNSLCTFEYEYICMYVYSAHIIYICECEFRAKKFPMTAKNLLTEIYYLLNYINQVEFACDFVWKEL